MSFLLPHLGLKQLQTQLNALMQKVTEMENEIRDLMKKRETEDNQVLKKGMQEYLKKIQDMELFKTQASLQINALEKTIKVKCQRLEEEKNGIMEHLTGKWL